MKILQVIHGYPPYYTAGSEVYTYNLANELTKHAEVFVFTRIENPFEAPYAVSDDVIEGVHIRRVNKPSRDYTMEDKYLDSIIDERFRECLRDVQPDAVHVGHLSHLSTNIVNIAKKEFGLPVVFTVHDFWMFCFRGQAIKPDQQLCPAPSDEGCLACAQEKFKDRVNGADMERYREHMQRMRDNIDIFLSPSCCLKDYFEANGISPDRICYSRYGFDRSAISFKKKHYGTNTLINFGYMGRVIPTKGILVLLKAFGGMKPGNSRLLLFGDAGQDHKYLSDYVSGNVVFKGAYKNWEIDSVLDEIDVLVVPSIWYENSPLVIQEAFLAGIPVITSDIGGMSELVTDGVDGLTFELGNADDLCDKMERISSDPAILNELKPDPAVVRSIQDDAAFAMKIYEEVLSP